MAANKNKKNFKKKQHKIFAPLQDVYSILC